MKYRLEVSKGTEVKYVSHLDTMKMMERALRRADVPLAFSEGFNPHPKIAAASALAVGVTSDKEYFELELVEQWDPAMLQEVVNKALPKGFVIGTVKIVANQGPSLMALINRADYIVTFAVQGTVAEESLKQWLAKLLDCETIKIVRSGKKGDKEVDIRPGIFKLDGHVAGDEIMLRMLIQTGSEGNIKPEEVVKALCRIGQVEPELASIRIHRLGLLINREDGLCSPLDC